MKKETYELFKSSDANTIVDIIEKELIKRNESPFWADKVVPFTKAILSVLIPLRDDNILFSPEGEARDELTPELFFEWSDFVSLKSLAFIIQSSNNKNKLVKTKYNEDQCSKYKNIDLSLLGEYLSKNNVNLEDESLDFPISTYNLHQGVSNVIKSLL